MYVRTPQDVRLGLGFPPPLPKEHQVALRQGFNSAVVTYKNAEQKCHATRCAIYVPSALRHQPKIDLVVFFHGLDTCPMKYGSDPWRVVQMFRMIEQIDNAARKAALVVPLVPFNNPDRDFGFIRAAWSAACLNSFVEETLDEIGRSSRVRPSLDRLIIAGHSAGFEILTPLAEQFDCGAAETNRRAMSRLSKVLALDIPHNERQAKALEDWARSRRFVEFILVFAKFGTPPTVWKARRTKMANVPLPKNLQVLNTNDGHCKLPENYLGLALK